MTIHELISVGLTASLVVFLGLQGWDYRNWRFWVVFGIYAVNGGLLRVAP